jgi:hypothetical protein
MSEPELSNASRKAELFGNLLSSIESQYGWQTDSFERARFDEWKKNGPAWQKEVISEALILKNRIGAHIESVRDVHGFTLDPLFFSKIYHEVWTYFENLPPEETKDVDRSRIVGEFEKVVSSHLDLSEATREALLESLKKPFHTRENIFRRVVGLNPLQGEGDEKGI